jgi:alpha-beta hydrolase superfamily lysophospholipase
MAVVAAAAPVGLAYRFALAYRLRAGYPRRNPPLITPADLGLPFETTTVESDGLHLPAWFIPARDGRPGPGVVLVHGWESARDRTLPMAVFLHAAGFHCLTFDVRGHGANPPETLPVSGGEFGDDAAAAFGALMGRPEVTVGAISGHSMGAIGAILAAAADPRVAGLVATSGPADPTRLTRQTFRLAHLPIPDPIAYPLAWLTARVYLRPRGHRVPDVSASASIARYAGPILLVHGDQDTVVPVGHLGRLAEAARKARESDQGAAPVETMIVPGGQHSWLYEVPDYRRAVARMLTVACGGPLDPAEAGEIAAATPTERIPDAETRFAAVEGTPGGLRTLARVALPGATRRQSIEEDGSTFEAAADVDPGPPDVDPGPPDVDPRPAVVVPGPPLPSRLAAEP